MDAKSIVNTLGGEWHGAYGLAPCPICQKDGRGRAMSVLDRRGYPYITCFKGCSPFQIKKALSIGCDSVELSKQERVEREMERIKRQEDAAKNASDIIRVARREKHPYFERKGFPKLRVPVVNGTAVFAMRDMDKKLWNVQRIYKDGTKKFLKGGRVAACGVFLGDEGPNIPIILCEGVATGMSIYRSLKQYGGMRSSVICCMSTSGLKSMVKENRNKLKNAVVMADNDESGAGEDAAFKTGLPYIMPSIRGDFNDLEISAGGRKVWEAYRRLRTQV